MWVASVCRHALQYCSELAIADIRGHYQIFSWFGGTLVQCLRAMGVFPACDYPTADNLRSHDATNLRLS
jgi:hypothetical protein